MLNMQKKCLTVVIIITVVLLVGCSTMSSASNESGSESIEVVSNDANEVGEMPVGEEPADERYLVMKEMANTVILPDTVKDVAIYKALRDKYVEAIKSNDATHIGALIADDYVFIQTSKVGPDFYGKKAYLRSRDLLDKVVAFNVDIIRVVQYSDQWGMEIGVETTTWEDKDGKQYDTIARYSKAINREMDGEWRYARTFMAWAIGSEYKLPDRNIYTLKNEYVVDYTGFGEWVRRPVDNDLFVSVHDLANENGPQASIRAGVSVAHLADHDASTGGSLVGINEMGAIFSQEDYFKAREKNAAPATGVFPRGHSMAEYVGKTVTEVIPMTDDIVFVYGKTVSSRPDNYVNTETYDRYYKIAEYGYYLKKQDDRWNVLFGCTATEHTN